MGILFPFFEKQFVCFLVAMPGIALCDTTISSLPEFQTSGVIAVIVRKPVVQLCLGYAL